jgi:hypothetical protein
VLFKAGSAQSLPFLCYPCDDRTFSIVSQCCLVTSLDLPLAKLFAPPLIDCIRQSRLTVTYDVIPEGGGATVRRAISQFQVCHVVRAVTHPSMRRFSVDLSPPDVASARIARLLRASCRDSSMSMFSKQKA